MAKRPPPDTASLPLPVIGQAEAPPEAADARAETPSASTTPSIDLSAAAAPRGEPRESMFDGSRRHVCGYMLSAVLIEMKLRVHDAVDLGGGRMVALDRIRDRLRAATDDDAEVDPDKVRRVVAAEIDRARARFETQLDLPSDPVANAGGAAVAPGLERLLGDLQRAKGRK